jgi:hypothetical protein
MPHSTLEGSKIRPVYKITPIHAPHSKKITPIYAAHF